MTRRSDLLPMQEDLAEAFRRCEGFLQKNLAPDVRTGRLTRHQANCIFAALMDAWELAQALHDLNGPWEVRRLTAWARELAAQPVVGEREEEEWVMQVS